MNLSSLDQIGLLLDAPSNLCLVVGDVTPTIACTIGAQKKLRVDTLLANQERLRRLPLWAASGLEIGGYFLMTLHRPVNVDKPAGFRAARDGDRGHQRSKSAPTRPHSSPRSTSCSLVNGSTIHPRALGRLHRRAHHRWLDPLLSR
jgi:hypothetical protein